MDIWITTRSHYPILRSHAACKECSFLPPAWSGSASVPWWDHIAYLMKTARSRRRFSLRYPAGLAVDIDREWLDGELTKLFFGLYKRPDNSDPARFIQELTEEAKGEEPPGTLRRFLNWDEAREMTRGGMAIGSHTHSHPVLSQLEPDAAVRRAIKSRAILKEQLGVEADVLAYPVGAKTSFTNRTKQAARGAGYRAAFSYHGGTNIRERHPLTMWPEWAYSIKAGAASVFQSAVCRVHRNFWP